MTVKRFLLVFLLLVIAWHTVQGQDEDIIEIEVEELPIFTETILLNTGWEMPLLGIDFSSFTPVQTENGVYLALKEGFRLIDIAGARGNEEAAGRAVRRAIEEGLVTREEIFITAGIWMEESESPDEAGDAAIQQSLTLLGLEYIDLMILNQNRYDLDLAAWQAMEWALAEGTVRSIGLSGFDEIRNFDLIVSQITVPPAVLRVETHPYRQNLELRQHLQQYGTVIEAKDPLGGAVDKAVLFADPAVSVAASRYRKTSDQIILRWHLQNGIIAIPAASDEIRLDEYYQVLDFELDNEDMNRLDQLDRTMTYIYY